MKNRIRRGLLALLVATAIWIPSLHFFFIRPLSNFRDPRVLSPKARQLAARHLQLWTDPQLRSHELARMRSSNAEWDLMGRMFLVCSLGEMSLRNPAEKARYLETMDLIIAETLRLERERGFRFFLMPYANRPYQVQPERSHFLDSEIALMLASRRMVEEKPGYKALLRERVDAMIAHMKQGPIMCAESYPNECWTFDHAAGLAAIRLADHLDGTDHSAFIHDWLTIAQNKLLDNRNTGLLVSSFTLDGEPIDGPEGSSIWFTAYCLRLVDENFARDQYERARKELGKSLVGFGWSREWPASWRGREDIDSGPVIPVLDISAGASGLAFIGASSFGDGDYLRSLAATLDFAAFPTVKQGRLKYCASNQVGDAALLYATVLGPLWDKAEGKP